MIYSLMKLISELLCRYYHPLKTMTATLGLLELRLAVTLLLMIHLFIFFLLQRQDRSPSPNPRSSSSRSPSPSPSSPPSVASIAAARMHKPGMAPPPKPDSRSSSHQDSKHLSLTKKISGRQQHLCLFIACYCSSFHRCTSS